MNKTLKLGLNISEPDYRSLSEPSYSLLSSISKHGPDALYGKRDDISDLDGIIIGSIVDSQVTEYKDPDNMVIITKKPSGKAIKVIKSLCDRNDLEDTNTIIGVKNKDIIAEICDQEDYYSNKDAEGRVKALKKYSKYAKELYKANGNTFFVSQYQYDTACALSDKIFSKYEFLKTRKDDILGQTKLIGEVAGQRIKCMLDFILFDHEKKIIHPFDLKTGYGEHHTFFETGYLGWGYYIQASLYRELLKQEAEKHPELKEYYVDNFRFLFCGRQDLLPVIYKVTEKQHAAGFDGFKHGNTYYPGIFELIDDYKYYLSRPNSRYRRGYAKSEIVFDDSYLQ